MCEERYETVEISKLEGIIEAILFTMGESVELRKIAAAIEHDEATTRKIIHQMMDKYAAQDRGITDCRIGRLLSNVYEDRDV